MIARLRPLAPCLAILAFACGSSPGPETQGTEAPAIEQPNGPDPAPAATGSGTSTPPPAIVPACDPLVPRTKPLELSVLPDAGATPFVSVLAKAQKSIRVMVYQMGTGPIIDTLEAKARAGVKVQIILDVAQADTNQKYMDRLKAAGADVIWSDKKFTYMHAKVIVVDGAEAVISTGNYAAFRMGTERNYVVRDTDPADVDVLVKLFDADFARKDPDLSCTRLIVSPVNSRERIVGVIAAAKSKVLVESMQLADKDVRDALAARKAAGVDVRVILADPGWIDTNAEAARFLAQNGIPARSLKDPGIHVKAISVDGRAAYVGSENMSWTSLSKNREVGLVVTEASNVAAMDATFEKDWAMAAPF
jgi:phosphatidylserine/phosphatidylglycerophosphate/cardiolipin synthase-like enzyme